MSFPYIESNGHYLIIIDHESFVVDTGSPVSFSFADNGKLDILGLPVSLPGALTGINKEKLENLVGRQLAGIIGMDALQAKGGITFDRETCTASFGTDESGRESFPVNLRSIQGLGILDFDCSICGKPAKAIFDTGAWVGYAHKSLLAGAECTGEVTDYGPSFGGQIKSKKYRADIQIGDFSTITELAQMTPTVELEVGLMGGKAIIGLNDFEWNRVGIDLVNMRVWID